ncbi:hypothetical protein, partial [Solicola sp. PLA-1-18]|uniref:hypothetical protein n=1 Tax=Solicola sp. PLA-1-18 TaxID=3380532 RepID=UPI003B788580
MAVGLLSAPAQADSAAPTPTGSVRVSSTPTAFGRLVGENGGALSSCSVGGRRVVVASGDVTAYAAGARGRGVTRV